MGTKRVARGSQQTSMVGRRRRLSGRRGKLFPLVQLVWGRGIGQEGRAGRTIGNVGSQVSIQSSALGVSELQANKIERAVPGGR